MKLYIDVTQLVNWQGKLTGIPRVMDELSRRFKEYDSESSRFITWNSAAGVFEPVSLERTREPSTDSTDPQPTKAQSGEKIAIKKVLRHLPAPVKSGLRKSYSRVRPNPVSRPIQAYSRMELEEGSSLLVVWGEWADPNYRQELATLMNEGTRLYQVAHDMLPLITPQFSGHSTVSLGQYASMIYPHCTGLIAVSENTEKDVINWLKSQSLKVPPTSVIRLGEDFVIKKARKPDHKFFSSGRPFVLSVGTIEIRKNHQLLYYAYKLARARGIAMPHLVIVGRRGWMTEQTYELMTKDPEVNDSFIFLHDTSDEELSWLYDHCRFTIYPSFYEGWGLPVAESVVRGVPCITSDTSSIPEVAGKLARYFNPASSEECLNRILELLDDEQLAIVKSNLRQYKPTTWDDTFEQVRTILGV